MNRFERFKAWFGVYHDAMFGDKMYSLVVYTPRPHLHFSMSMSYAGGHIRVQLMWFGFEMGVSS